MNHKIGLGNEALNRIRLIFIFLILLVLLTGGSTIYESYKSGQLRQLVVEPVNQIIAAWQKSQEEMKRDEELRKSAQQTVNTIISTSKNTPARKTQNQNSYTYTYPTPKPVEYTNKSYEQSLKELDEWSKQKSAENQQRYEEATKKSKEQSQQWYNQQVEQMNKDLEEWKKQNGF